MSIRDDFRTARAFYMAYQNQVAKVLVAIENHQPTQRAVEIAGVAMLGLVVTGMAAEATVGTAYVAAKIPNIYAKVVFGASAAAMTAATAVLARSAVKSIKDVWTDMQINRQQLSLF